MSLVTSGEKCVLCNAYLFEDDDVVHCPVCGAPHHRECYNSTGSCALEKFHGTENQYQKFEKKTESDNNPQPDNMVVCGLCGEKYHTDSQMCPNCNTPNISKTGSFISFDFSGGVADDTDLGNGVKAKEAKLFVRSNTQRYLPKFLKFKNGGKASWNWLAFLIPCSWLLSRKMYILGSIIGALQIATSLLTAPFIAAFNTIDTTQVTSYQEYVNIFLENSSDIGKIAIISAAVGVVLGILIRVILGVFGDLFYKHRVINKISELKEQNNATTEMFFKKGGVNLWIALIGYFAVTYLPTIIANTLGIL